MALDRFLNSAVTDWIGIFGLATAKIETLRRAIKNAGAITPAH
jgi:hypothetical protein